MIVLPLAVVFVEEEKEFYFEALLVFPINFTTHV